MRKHSFIIFSILLIGFSCLQAGQLPYTLDSLITAGKQDIYDLKFKQAETHFIKAQQLFPGYPHGYFYQAYITVLVYSMDQSNEALEETLKAQVDRANEVAESFQTIFEDDPESYFMLALTSGIQATYHVLNRNFVRGYLSGRKTKGNLEKAVALDSAYYDAYFGLGLFHYYADLLPGMIKFIAGILGFEGDREQGMREILTTSRNGKHFQVEGEFMYYSISYFLEGDKMNALRGLRQLYARYPHNQAIGLMIAYHYRRSGFVEKCIETCERFGDEHADFLPQLTNLKYYNMAVCYFELNEFEKSDSLITRLEELPTRKSKYYQSAIQFYKGRLADIRGDRREALARYERIENHKQSEYWRFLSRMYVKYPVDSLMREYLIADNLLGSRRYEASYHKSLALKGDLDAGRRSVNPNAEFLIFDLLARNHFYQRRYRESQTVYSEFVPRLDQMEDEFHRAWIYIHYQRCLRTLEEFDLAEQMLAKANSLDDSFTRIIVEREKFMLKKRRSQLGQDQHDDD